MKNNIRFVLAVGFVSLSPVLASAAVAAEDTNENWHFSGFMSVVAGAALSGSYNDPLSYNPQMDCPCVITDWSNGGVYEGSNWTFQPDTKAGIQLSYDFTDHISFTSQIVRRASDNSSDWDKDLQWAYLTYKLNNNWSVDAGRKRVPLYYYSEFQDVGFTYTMITPTSAMYGWEVNNYDGASVNYNTNWNGINMQASLFGGGSTVKESHYTELYYPTTTNNQWHNIGGATFEMNKDWWVARVNYVQADVQFEYKDIDWKDRSDMNAYSLAFNGDFGDWFFVSEVGQNNRKDADFPKLQRVAAPSYSVGVGYRFMDKWTAMVNTAQFRERSNDPYYEYFRWQTNTVVVRYDLTPKSDIKVQFDKQDDKSYGFTGDGDLLRVSYDVVF
jgi:hypothetical protein